MRIAQLRYFATIARLKSVSQAAKQLHLSQSSLSKNVASLEEELGVPLFLRKGKKLVLNPAGARMLEFCNLVLRELEYAVDDIRELATGTEGRLKIGTAGYCDRLTGCLAAFRRQFPETEFELSGDIEGNEHLDINEYDMLIYPDEWEYEKYTGFPLYEERYAVAVPAAHRLAKLPLLGLKALEGQDVVFLRSGRKYTEYPFQICGALALHFSTQSFADSRELHRQMIAEGACIGFVPMSCTSFYMGDGSIRLIPVEDQRFKRQMMVCFRREKYLTELAKSFRDFVLDYFSVKKSDKPAL